MTEMLSVDILKTIINNRNNVKSNLKLYHKNASWETFQLAMRLLNPQSYGAQFETRVREAYGWDKVNATRRKGDAKFFDGEEEKFTEIKISLITDVDIMIHIVQIRPNHKMDFYDIFVIYQDGNFEHFRLTKDEIYEELLLTGHNLAHGTIDNNDREADNAEFRIDFPAGSEVHKRWKEKYLIDDNEILKSYDPVALEIEKQTANSML